jgi:cobaltochelatase CobN
MREWLGELNTHALKNVTGRLREAMHRGMGKAGDQMKEKLRSHYLGIEGTIEELLDEPGCGVKRR